LYLSILNNKNKKYYNLLIYNNLNDKSIYK
jgi:hypothetical protein